MISGNMVGSYSQMGKTLLLVDEDGNEITGVVVNQETVFTAHDNDVREGMVYASECGVSTGTKDIPAYKTTQSSILVLPGEAFSIPLSHYDKYNYTKLQAIITKFNTSVSDSVFTEKIVFEDCVYLVNSLTKVSDVLKNIDAKSIDLNLTNDTDDMYMIHYFTYKEEI